MHTFNETPAAFFKRRVQYWQKIFESGVTPLMAEKYRRINLKEAEYDFVALIASVEQCEMEIAYIVLHEFWERFDKMEFES